MKKLTFAIVIMFAVFWSPALDGAETLRGVAGVDVILKQNTSSRTMTNARGLFGFEGLAPGSYTLIFRARKAQETKTAKSDEVTVATSYSIKIDGTKRPVSTTNLTSNNLIAGVDVPIQVGPNAKVRGQVAAGALKKMVWIPQEPGSHIPGRWVPADSPEGKRAFKSNAYGASGPGLRKWMERAADVAQEGSPVADRTRDQSGGRRW
jgi:carboxypeptidase family protein